MNKICYFRIAKGVPNMSSQDKKYISEVDQIESNRDINDMNPNNDEASKGDEANESCKKIERKRNFSQMFELDNEDNDQKSFLCSICSDYIVLPICLICGHNFCKDCISKWIETKKFEYGQHPSCPVCRTKVCVDVNAIGVNKLLQSCINAYVSSLECNEDTESFKKRQKKSSERDERNIFVKNYKKSKKYKGIRSKIDTILKDCNGIIKYNELVEKIKELDVDKVELDLFFASKVKKTMGFILVGDFVVDCWNYDNMGINSDVVKYLQKNPKELLYAFINDAFPDSYIIDEFNAPQSEFFKTIVDEKKVTKALFMCKKGGIAEKEISSQE